MTPHHLIAEFRAALAAEDWTHASSLLDAYDACLRTAAAAGLPRETWRQIRDAHQMLLADVVAARDAVARAMASYAQGRDGARAYLAQQP